MSAENKLSMLYTSEPLLQPLPDSHPPDGGVVALNTLTTARPTYAGSNWISYDADREEAYAATQALRQAAIEQAQDHAVRAKKQAAKDRANGPYKQPAIEPMQQKIIREVAMRDKVAFHDLDDAEKRGVYQFLGMHKKRLSADLGESPLVRLLQLAPMVKDDTFEGVIPPDSNIRLLLGLKTDNIEDTLLQYFGENMSKYQNVMARYNGLDEWKDEYYASKFKTQSERYTSPRVTMLASAALFFRKNIVSVPGHENSHQIWKQLVTNPNTTARQLAIVYLASHGLDVRSMAYTLDVPFVNVATVIRDRMPELIPELQVEGSYLKVEKTLKKIAAVGRDLFIHRS